MGISFCLLGYASLALRMSICLSESVGVCRSLSESVRVCPSPSESVRAIGRRSALRGAASVGLLRVALEDHPRRRVVEIACRIMSYHSMSAQCKC